MRRKFGLLHEEARILEAKPVINFMVFENFTRSSRIEDTCLVRVCFAKLAIWAGWALLRWYMQETRVKLMICSGIGQELQNIYFDPLLLSSTFLET